MTGIRFRSWRHPGVSTGDTLTLGERVADQVVDFFASWNFVIGQTFFVAVWMFLNTWHGWHYMWDTYPFILLNLSFSTQAAYAAPLVMIAQKRNAQIAGERSEYDHTLLMRIARHLGISVGPEPEDI